ncbi:hypothetical protein EV360DRAFT_81671 [Lentinula raphanica]|nr:hypothetical protein EV360DRAFT_81671 [Lentinula raphanica]
MSTPVDNLKGLKNVIEAFSDEPYSFAEQAADDLDAEKEASYTPIQPVNLEDEEMDVLKDHPESGGSKEVDEDMEYNQPSIDTTGLREILNEASKGVSQDTAADYRRIMNRSEDFLVKRGLIAKGHLFVSPPHEDSAEMIVAVIMDA